MKKFLSWVSVLGLLMTQIVTACGDAGHSRRRPGPNEDGGATDGGSQAVAGTLSAGGVPAAGADGEPGEPSGGTANEGGTNMGAGGTFASGGTGEPGTAGSEAGPEGGTPSSAGTGPTDAGRGGTEGESGGTGSGATGGEGPAGGTGPAGGSGGDGAGASSGGGTGGGSGGESDAGSGGSATEPVAECNDGVLSPKESCCTAEWVDANISIVTALLGGALTGTTGCIARQRQSALAICSSAACEGGATGCRTEITAAALEYSPDTQEISGTASLVIDGRASAGSAVGCNFQATIEDLRFRAHVLRAITPASVHLSLAEPDIEDYTVRVDGCFGFGDVAAFLLNNALAREAIEAPIRSLLLRRLEADLPCPY